MRFFIDEGGLFTPASGWGVVCSLAIPHKEVGPARREIERLSQGWPRKDGELKGGLLRPAHLYKLVEVLFRHDALLHACAIDVSREDKIGVDRHKASQCERITKYLTSTQPMNFIRQIWELRHALERMPTQLYIQCVLMTELVASAIEETIPYFAQRRPRELAEFEWTIDAKDPCRVSPQEEWWRGIQGPFQEARTRREAMRFFRGPGFDYRFLDRKFSIQKEVWYPDRPRGMARGYDIKKMVTERIEFVDSRSETLIQAVDILASFLRQLLGDKITDDEVACALGKLQIIRRQGEQPQSLKVLQISRLPGGRTGLFRIVRTMTLAGRNMIKPSRRIAA
jgi:hypothetical protein